MERSYLRRYRGQNVERFLESIDAGLGGEVFVEGELGADEAELWLVDDLTLAARSTTGTQGTRADVLYVNETSGRVRLDGPICGERYGGPGAAADLALPLPLPLLLWRGRVSAGTWVVVTSRAELGYERALIRVAEEALARGRELALDLEWCGAA